MPARNASYARGRYVAYAMVTIVAGLAVHVAGDPLPPDVRDIVGDALWAVMMVWWVSALAPAAPLFVRAAVAYGVCVAVEFSQLIHTASLDAMRATTLGHLVMGSGFDARDLVAYLAGVSLATLANRGVGVRR